MFWRLLSRRLGRGSRGVSGVGVAAAGQQSARFTRRTLWTSAAAFKQDIAMPSLSPTMTEGTIVKWSIKEGEEISAGSVLCEIQTDKAVVSLEVDDDGILAKIVKEKDTPNIKVGELIAVLADPDEDWQEVAKSVGEAPESSGESEAPVESSGPTGGSTPGTTINMPSMSPTMTEGTIVSWKKKEGEKISAGDVIAEIQTDKAVVALEADDDAVMAKIIKSEGSTGVQVGELIALTVEEGEDWQDVQIPALEKAAAPVEKVEKGPEETKAETPSSVSGTHEFVHIPQAGPATNFLLTQYGIDPSQVSPSGPKGLIKSDVMNYIKEKQLKPIKVSTEAIKAPEPQVPSAPREKKPTSGFTDHPLSSMRSVIAKRLTQSKQTSPHGHCTTGTRIDSVLRLRRDLAAAGVKVSLNDIILKAVATALQCVPEMNLNVTPDDDFKVMPNVDISVAVATESGLITPIVRDVPSKSLEEISSTVKDLAGRAREGRLQLNEFQGGTFTISNLGMFGISEFTAIINPPQVGILAVGSGSQEVDPETGKAFTLMRSTLSFDRRFVDEALASDFMSTLQKVLEQPEYMNLGLVPTVRKDRLKSANV